MYRPHNVLYKIDLPTKQNIVEIKYTDVAEDAAPSEKFQWFISQSYEYIPLKFIKMEGTKRYFENGIELDIDSNTCTFTCKNLTCTKVTNKSYRL